MIEIFTFWKIVGKHFLAMDDWASKLFSSSCKLWIIQRRRTSESNDGWELTSKLSNKEIFTTSNQNGLKYRCHILYIFCFFNESFSFSGVPSSGLTRWRWKATLKRTSVEQFIRRDSFLNVKPSTAQWMLFWIIRDSKLMPFV